MSDAVLVALVVAIAAWVPPILNWVKDRKASKVVVKKTEAEVKKTEAEVDMTYVEAAQAAVLSMQTSMASLHKELIEHRQLVTQLKSENSRLEGSLVKLQAQNRELLAEIAALKQAIILLQGAVNA